MYYQNVRGILNKGNEFEVNILSLIASYNIFVLTETWLGQERFFGEYFDLERTQLVRADYHNLERTNESCCLLAVGTDFILQIIKFPQQFLQSFVDIDSIAIKN